MNIPTLNPCPNPNCLDGTPLMSSQVFCLVTIYQVECECGLSAPDASTPIESARLWNRLSMDDGPDEELLESCGDAEFILRQVAEHGYQKSELGEDRLTRVQRNLAAAIAKAEGK
jgi:hypothetical protein